jgi:molecular chaperone HscB
VPVNAESNTAMPAVFLMQQMEWREQLEAAHSAQYLEQIRLQVKQAVRSVLEKIEHLIDQQGAYAEAVGQVRALMFIERFEQDVDGRLDQIEI